MRRICALSLPALALVCLSLRADEGMWLYNQFPKDQVKQKFGFQVTDEFLNHLRLSSVRMGASGSFVSPHGLIFTNHHVASGCIQKVSSAEHNYMANGFFAATQAQELKCPDTEVSVLLNIKDVTGDVQGAMKAPAGTPASDQQRRAAIAKIEKDCNTSTGNQCEVVTLYSGALYDLYQYKKYTDIRLVFAPEEAYAFFGGDPDNFRYPRYDLDITFMRAYENNKPASTPNYLKWSHDGIKEGELAFVSGNPATTDRFITYSHMEFLRDVRYPIVIRYLNAAIKTLDEYGAASAENHRVARDKLFGAANSQKAYTDEYRGLQDPKLFAVKRASEQKLRSAIERDSRLRQQTGDSFERIAAAYKKWTPNEKAYFILEGGPRYSDLFRIARTIVRLTEEKPKPNGDRLREFQDAALPSLESRLYSTAPISDSLEVAVLATYFRFLQQEMGANDPTVRAVLAGLTPERAAEQYVSTSKLKDVAERKRLAASAAAVKSSKDGMIRLALLLDPPSRQVRKVREDELDAVERAAATRIAQARFAAFGANEYPDATGTLRLSFGAVKSYRDSAGKQIRYYTDFAGMYGHATGQDPFRLPDRVLKAKGALDLATPLNFVSTCDIIGGNSGSPTVNQKGEVIGILFDSNLEAMPNRFVYSETAGRAVHVAVPGIVEALQKIYGANRIVTELGFPAK
jgi:alpha-D-ribose 1-methylphosphonate 5-triphosphate synthase subunit PhnH